MRKRARRVARARRRYPLFEPLELRRLLSLTHLYTFNDGTANDSIGGANATLFNGASVVEGWLTLQNYNGTSSNTLSTALLSGDPLAQYAQLPAGTLPSSGSATIEVWYTSSSAAPNWTRIFDFGDQVNGAGNSYFFYTPRSSSSDARGVLHPAGSTDRVAALSGGTFDGRAHMAAVVVDASAGQLRLYVDGTLSATSSLNGASMASISSSLGFLGRSMFNVDPAYTGSIDEVRIYNDAQGASAIAAQAASGATRTAPALGSRQIENLDRGIVAFNRTSTSVYLSWRLLAGDPTDVSFNVYRSVNGASATKLNSTAITKTTDYIDATASLSATNTYWVRAVVNGVEQSDSKHFTIAANSAVNQYLNIPLNVPAGGTLPDGTAYTYAANDASVGDLDGDGQYEIVLKWDPQPSYDSSQDGFTAPTLFDAYRLDGTFMWRINLGQNVRAGAHYTQFIVYDLDGDGKAEIAMKTAPGTIDGAGTPVLMGTDKVTDDYRNATSGRINTGPEYLTVFRGSDGAQLATTAFKPDRVNTSSWGDDYGNRQDRILMTVAYLDGVRPSLVVGRGIFPGQNSSHAVRNEITAWNFRGGNLSMIWWFRADRNTSAYGLPNVNTSYIGQGTYDMHPADVDGDGKDEIMYGEMAINSNGTPRYSTGLGHGDAMHTSDLDPTRAGQEVFMPEEDPASYGIYGGALRDASTGQLLEAIDGHLADVGRGVAVDIDPRYLGAEMWQSADGFLYDVKGNVIQAKPSNMFQNFVIQWDADPQYELLDGTTLSNWVINSSGVGGRSNYLSGPAGVASNNSTKSTPCLTADIFGDYREEVIWRTSDNTALQIWSTTISATTRQVTMMDDVQYREAIAWQNVGYNQPPHTSYYVGDGMRSIPVANVYLAGGPSNVTVSSSSVPENQSAGTLVGLLATASAGTSNTFTYSFVTGSGSVDNSSFQIVGNQLLTTASFNYEAKNSYTIRVRTTDGAGLTYDRQLTISVSNVNEAPTIASTAGASPNPTSIGTTQLNVLGADIDPGGEGTLTYTWSLTGSPPAAVTYSANGTNAAKNTTATFSKAGTYAFLVTVTDNGGLTATSTVNVTVYSSIAGRKLFYSGSAFAASSHDNAIAPDKSALLAGQAASFANYSSYSRGLNGIMVDIARPAGTLAAGDFVFKVGNDNTPAGWSAAPAPLSVLNRPGAGAAGSTRIEITWADGAIVNQWLQVTVKGGAGAASGLAADDVFYFGNTPGEVGNDPASARVDAFDQLTIRYAATASAMITALGDITRDGVIDTADENAARANATYFLNELRLITAPGAPLAAGALTDATPLAGPAIASPTLAGTAPAATASITDATSPVDNAPAAPLPLVALTQRQTPLFVLQKIQGPISGVRLRAVPRDQAMGLLTLRGSAFVLVGPG